MQQSNIIPKNKYSGKNKRVVIATNIGWIRGSKPSQINDNNCSKLQNIG